MNNERFSRQSFLGEHGQAAIERRRRRRRRASAAAAATSSSSSPTSGSSTTSCSTATARRVEPEPAGHRHRGRRRRPARRRSSWRGAGFSSIRSAANVETFTCRWQDRPEPLRGCDIVFGCVDSFAERRELEIACRRHLIPLIDIGMDVHPGRRRAAAHGRPGDPVDARRPVHDLPAGS